jgi:hypothetical protein
MLFSFDQALREINTTTPGMGTQAVRLANGVRPPAEYILNQILPNQNVANYQADAKNMTLRTTMAGMVGMDSEYPEGGLIQMNQFSESTAKIAVAMTLREEQLREMQTIIGQMRLNGATDQTVTTQLVTEALNFLNKVGVQACLDTEEWLKGMALSSGVINWTFNGKKLTVDYGIPAANFLTNWDDADAYDGASSKFWQDMKAHRKLQKDGIAAIIMHPVTADAIQYNSVNNIVLVSDPLNPNVRIWRKINPSTNTFTSDAQDTITVITHGSEGEIYDRTKPGFTSRVSFWPIGVVASIGRNVSSGYRVGQGSTAPLPTQLGYGHVAPTVEGGGNVGRWARLYTPQMRPWELRLEAVENFLPVIEAPEKIVIANSTIQQ